MTDRIAEIRERRNASTSGPGTWEVEEVGFREFAISGVGRVWEKEDADFIDHAPDDIDYLLKRIQDLYDERRALRKQIEELEKLIEGYEYMKNKIGVKEKPTRKCECICPPDFPRVIGEQFGADILCQCKCHKESAALSLLRQLEWGYWDGEYYWDTRCPICHEYRKRVGGGHAADCKLKEVIG